MIANIITIIFYLLMLAFAVYSFIATYSLLSYGRSKILGLTISILFIIIIASLYTAAASNLNKLQ